MNLRDGTFKFSFQKAQTPGEPCPTEKMLNNMAGKAVFMNLRDGTFTFSFQKAQTPGEPCPTEKMLNNMAGKAVFMNLRDGIFKFSFQKAQTPGEPCPTEKMLNNMAGKNVFMNLRDGTFKFYFQKAQTPGEPCPTGSHDTLGVLAVKHERVCAGAININTCTTLYYIYTYVKLIYVFFSPSVGLFFFFLVPASAPRLV